jgi:curli biogenesis system outer membrane secretion channel CsgG
MRTFARRAAAGFLASLALGALPATAQTAGSSSAMTVAVLDFDNSALVRGEQFAPLSKGIADMLITQLAGNRAIRIVEREHIQKVLDEINLAGSTRVDPETAVRIGKLLGARYFLTGVFVIDPGETMRMDIRAVNVETSEVEYVETVKGKAENVLALIDDLSAKVSKGLRFPPMTNRSSSVPAPSPVKVSAADQYRAFFLVSRSIEEQDKKNYSAAIALLRQALDLYPNYERARVRLASLQKGGE